MLLQTEKYYMETSALFQLSRWQNLILLFLSVYHIAIFVLLSSINFLFLASLGFQFPLLYFI